MVMLEHHHGLSGFLSLDVSHHHSCMCLYPNCWYFWCIREFDSTALVCTSCRAVGSSGTVERRRRRRRSSSFLKTSTSTLCKFLNFCGRALKGLWAFEPQTIAVPGPEFRWSGWYLWYNKMAASSGI
ncbi:Hypothetical predicted protein [Octopus vulgaris]|uniref:Uncharacterized protein n=1 Tax=Octopus vulgaris TaxID=6645 RepID=A0AA36FGG6_OCTVU|nr:Hypothetical predicted protein [Octopus vulgaris]